MPLPSGLTLCALTFGGDVDFSGNPVTVAVSIAPSTDLVWKATGQRILGKNFPQTTPAILFASSISMPVTDQPGLADGNGNDVLHWFYVVTVTYQSTSGSETVVKNWQPITGQSSVDFDMIPSGPVTPAYTAPTAVVTSFNGQTGAVTYAGGGGTGTGTDTGAVHYTADTPTGPQQAQARANLGLAAVAASGSYTDLSNKPTGLSNPWEFRPEDYGAKADGRFASDAATNGTNTFTSPTVAAAAAVGQWVMISGGRGVADTAAIGTITAISGNNITIDTTARGLPVNATHTGLDVLWGSDDTAAINAAAAAAKTYAEAHNYTADVVFQDRMYVVSGLTQSNDGNIMYNTSIPIPRPTDNNGRKLLIGFKGVQRVSHTWYWNSTHPALGGTVIASTHFGPNTIDPTYSYQSVFGAGTPPAGALGQPLDVSHQNPVFVNHKPIFEHIQILMPAYTNLTGFDWQNSASLYTDGCSAGAFASPLYGNGVVLVNQFNTTVFAGKNGCGARLPVVGNNADTVCPDFTAIGIACGMAIPAEQTMCGNLKIIYSGVAINIVGGATGNGHALTIQRMSAEGYQIGIRNAVVSAPGRCPIFIAMWETELSGPPVIVGGEDVYDPGNTLSGEIHWLNTSESGHQFPGVNGGNNVRIICESVNRGLQTAPAVPATTVALQNPFWRDATVRVSGGTVTVVSVDGQTVATATNSTVTVPTGKSITLTYSSAPTWTWALL